MARPPCNLPACKALSERRYRRNRCMPFYRRPVRVGSAFPRLPRRFAPRNDNSGASTILSATCTNCQFSAGRGMPLPYNARLETSCNFTLSTFHFPLAPCRTDNDRPHPDRRGRSFSVYLPYRRSYIVFMRRRRDVYKRQALYRAVTDRPYSGRCGRRKCPPKICSCPWRSLRAAAPFCGLFQLREGRAPPGQFCISGSFRR